MPKPSELAAQSPATVASLRSVLGVGALEAVVESAAGPTYASIALGEAATTAGQSFAVDNGDGTVSIYLRTGGGSTLQRTLATTAALAGIGGAAMVGFKAPGTGSVSRTLEKRIQDYGVSVLDFIPVSEHAAIRAFTSTYDSTPGIQAAVDYATYGGGKGKVFIPAGKYRTTGPIHLGYGVGYSSVVLEGAGSSYRGESAFSGTVISCDFSNAPGIVIQGGRRTSIRDIAIVGKNASYVQSNGLGSTAPVVRDTSVSAWVDPSLAVNANSRYAPYAGIAIDPYSGPRKPDTYPDVLYPAHFGAVAQYGKDYTDCATITDVYIGGFVVGLVVQPGDADGNGDHISMRNFKIERCAYGVSLGNSQGRSTNLDNGSMFYIHTALANKAHGKLRGKFAGYVAGLSFNMVIQLVDIDPGYNDPLCFSSCYGELIWRIGNFGGVNSSNSTLAFRDCDFGFQSSGSGAGDGLRGLPIGAASVAHGCLVLDGGKFTSPTALIIGGQAEIRGGTFIYSEMFDGQTTISDAGIAFFGSTMGVLCEHTTAPRIKKLSMPAFGATSHGAISARVVGDVFPSNYGTRNYPMPPTTRQIQEAAIGPPAGTVLPVSAPYYQWNKVSLVINAADPQAVTVDFSALDVAGYRYYGVSKGDHIADSTHGIVLLITSVSGNIATCVALNGYYTEDGVRKWEFGSFNVAAGTFFVTVNRLFCTRYPTFVDITSGAVGAINVGRMDGGSLQAAEVAVGDMPFVSEHQFRPFSQGTTVTALNGGARTITFSGIACYTDVRVPLRLWVRAPL